MKVFSVHEVLEGTRLQLYATRQQLKHQNERAEMAEIFIEQLATELGAGATVAEVVDRVAQWLDADHGGRLAEVRAEAGRAGFIEGYEQCHYDIDNDYISRSEPMADQYAAKVRGGAA